MTQDQKRYLNFLESEMAETLAASEHDEEANMRDVIALDEDIMESQSKAIMRLENDVNVLVNAHESRLRECRALRAIAAVAVIGMVMALVAR